MARLFWVNYLNFLLNAFVIGFPLDGGRMFQSVLWGYVGYRQATLAAGGYTWGRSPRPMHPLPERFRQCGFERRSRARK